jgi:hypothetical protein
LGSLLFSYRHTDGSWTPLQSLTIARREQLDGTISGLLDHLSVVPGVLEIQGDDNDA